MRPGAAAPFLVYGGAATAHFASPMFECVDAVQFSLRTDAPAMCALAVYAVVVAALWRMGPPSAPRSQVTAPRAVAGLAVEAVASGDTIAGIARLVGDAAVGDAAMGDVDAGVGLQQRVQDEYARALSAATRCGLATDRVEVRMAFCACWVAALMARAEGARPDGCGPPPGLVSAVEMTLDGSGCADPQPPEAHKARETAQPGRRADHRRFTGGASDALSDTDSWFCESCMYATSGTRGTSEATSPETA